MRHIRFVVAFAVLAATVSGCAFGLGNTATLRGVTPQAADDAFTTATNTLVQMGYTVDEADREAGFVVAEHRHNNWNLATNVDIIRVTLTEADNGVRFRVTASRDVIPLNGDRRPARLSSDAQQDAQKLREALAGS